MKARIKFKRMTEDGKVPTKKRKEDAGLDVYAAQDVELLPGYPTKVKTDLQLADATSDFPFYLNIAARSGLAENAVIPIGGVVDSIYRGEIGVILANIGNKPYNIKKGDRIGQLIAQLIFCEGINLTVEESDNVTTTDRNDKGFGSSGV